MANEKFNRNAFLLSILFIISCLPLVLSISHIGQEETRQFSIYNAGFDGTSILRSNLESEGYTIKPIVSTLNVLTRLDEAGGVLTIIGPTIFFDPSETAALMYFISRGGSVLIADDFGSANDMLSVINAFLPSLIGNFDTRGIPIQGLKFNKSLLMDAGSYYTSPVMPVIETFYSESGFPSTAGVNSIITSFPTAITFKIYDNTTDTVKWVPIFSYENVTIPSGFAVSSSESWLEKDVEKAREGDFFPDEDEWGGAPFSVILPLPLSAGGGGNIILCSDPSIFINELMSFGAYDNSQLASNLFDWLDFNNTRTIYYDESHLSSAAGKLWANIIDPFTYVSLYLRIIDSFTMFPLLAPLFPLITFLFLRRRFPKGREPSALLMTKVKQSKSRSFFAAKMTWYMNYQKFAKALSLVYSRLKRQINRRLGLKGDLKVEQILDILEKNYPNQFNLEEVEENLIRITDIIEKNKRITEEEFTSLIFSIKDIEEVVTKPIL